MLCLYVDCINSCYDYFMTVSTLWDVNCQQLWRLAIKWTSENKCIVCDPVNTYRWKEHLKKITHIYTHLIQKKQNFKKWLFLVRTFFLLLLWLKHWDFGAFLIYCKSSKYLPIDSSLLSLERFLEEHYQLRSLQSFMFQ